MGLCGVRHDVNTLNNFGYRLLGTRELAEQARKLRPGLKILFMTGSSRNAVVHQGRVDKDVDLLQKPITQAQLSTRIREVLDRR